MSINNLNFFKFLFSFILFIIGINFFYKGLQTINNIDISNNSSLIKNITNDKIKNFKLINKDNSKFEEEEIITNLEKNIFDKKNLIQKIIIVKKNDTFSKIIKPYFDNKLKSIIINKINEEYDLKNLKIGQKIFLYYNNNIIKKIALPISFDEDIVLEINNNNAVLKKEKADIKIEYRSLKFTISSSLYKDGINEGIPLPILTKAIQLYSFDIDFQRDIKKNTKFEVTYNAFYNSEKQTTNYGNIEYIKLQIENRNLEYFIFKTNEGFYDYFNKDGKNVKKSILKTPIDGAKLSSNFGMRKHPILGYNKLHKGVDFSAPKGTPIFAGGNGIIEYIGNNGGYGKYIRIRHNNEYKTAYAHLSSFNKNISKGKRINQGDIIGYVGSTGKSTGPHLHYEVIFQNKQINLMNLKLPSGKILAGEELKRFKDNTKNIYARHLHTLYE